MKLTALFHMSLITMATGLTADLTAAAAKLPEATTAPARATPAPAMLQQNAQSSSSAQAEAKEARAKQNAAESEVQEPLTLRFEVPDESINPLIFNKEESFFMLAHLLDVNIERLRRAAAQIKPISISKDEFGAILIVKVSELAETAEDVRANIVISIPERFRSSQANQLWRNAYTQSVDMGEIQPRAGRDLLAAVFPPAPAVKPARSKSTLTKIKDFLSTHRLARYGVYALAGAAAIYGGYRVYQRVNMRKLARYVKNWA